MLVPVESNQPQPPQPSILIVEDNHHDALLLTHALKALRSDWIPLTVADGEAARRWLSRGAAHKEALPIAIILDLSLPGADGAELLTWIDTQRHLDRVRTLVVSAHVQRPVGMLRATGRLVVYLPKPVSAFAIAAALTS